MATGFLGSKAFLLSALVAVGILAAGLGAYAMSVGPGGRTFSAEGGCDAPAMGGAPLAVTPEVVVEDDGARRTETYALDAAAFHGGAIDLCAVVGEILVEPAAGTRAELVFVIAGSPTKVVRSTVVEARFAAQGDRLLIGGWESLSGRSSGPFGGDTADVRTFLRVPASGAWSVRASMEVGDVRVSDLLVDDLRLASEVGNLRAIGVDLQGNATLDANVGDAIAQLASVQTGRIALAAEVGDLELRLPQRADVGYDALGETDVGEVELRLGPSEDYDSEGDGPGERERAKTAGFASKPTQVTVEAVDSVGDVLIVVE